MNIFQTSHLEKKYQKMDEIGEVEKIIFSFINHKISEDMFVYILEIRNNSERKIKEIEKFEDLNIFKKDIKKIKILGNDLVDNYLESRKKLCDVFGIEFIQKNHSNSLKDLDGILSLAKDNI